MSKANDGKSDPSVSYNISAPLNKEEAWVTRILSEGYGEPNAWVESQILALLNDHIRKARIDELNRHPTKVQPYTDMRIKALESEEQS